MPEQRIDRAERLIDAPAERIWLQLSERERLAQWLPPHGARAEVHAFELRSGGDFRMTLIFPPGVAGKAGAGRDEVEGRVVTVEAPRRLEWEVEFPSDDPDNAGTMRMRWDLAPEGRQTRVTVQAFDPPRGIDAQVHRKALEDSLAHLAIASEHED